MGGFVGGATGRAGDWLTNSAGGQYFDRISADAQGTVGEVLPFVKNRNDRRKALLKQFADAEKSMEDRALEKIKSGAAGALSTKYTSFIEEINAARTRGDAATATQLQGELNAWLNSNKPGGAASQYIDFATKGQFTDDAGNILTGAAAEAAIGIAAKDFDGTISGTMLTKVTNAATLAGVDMGSDASAMHSAFSGAKKEIGDIENRQMAIQQAKSGN